MISTTTRQQNSNTDRILDGQEYNLSKLEHTVIMAALRKMRGNRTRAAEILGISVRTIRNKINLYREKGMLDCDKETGEIQPWLRKRKRGEHYK